MAAVNVVPPDLLIVRVTGCTLPCSFCAILFGTTVSLPFGNLIKVCSVKINAMLQSVKTSAKLIFHNADI